MIKYIYQREGWPEFNWDESVLMSLLGKVRNKQGRLIGRIESMGLELRSEAALESTTEEIIKSSSIEGEILDSNQVRSSLARRLGMEKGGLVLSSREIDGYVDLLIDATANHNKKLTKERLLGWHSALFPSGRSGMFKIRVGKWRDDSSGRMQVISGASGKAKVHFEAPGAASISKEMTKFINWLNKDSELDGVLKAGIAHLWFITIHPFDDGNGRITRAITDMLLTRSDGVSERYYSMSSQIRKERKEYYEALERTQKGNLDITEWLKWFLECLLNSFETSSGIIEKVIIKHQFWLQIKNKNLNDRQRKMINKLIDGFEGKLTTKKWAQLMKCSHDTALRDIQNLIDKKIMEKDERGGRSTSYMLIRK